MTPLTLEIAETLKPGTELVSLGDVSGYPSLEKGKIYTFEKTKQDDFIIVKDQHNFGWYPHRFAIVDKDYDIKTLIDRANLGRKFANELIDEYSDRIKIENGEYKLK